MLIKIKLQLYNSQTQPPPKNVKLRLHSELQLYWEHFVEPSSLSFNSGKFVRGFTKYCLNKAQFGALSQRLSGEHPVWIAADRLLTMSPWMHIHCSAGYLASFLLWICLRENSFTVGSWSEMWPKQYLKMQPKPPQLWLKRFRPVTPSHLVHWKPF